VEEYLARQERFAHLVAPARDQATLDAIQARVDAYWRGVEPGGAPVSG
jgi:hypothetical protein